MMHHIAEQVDRVKNGKNYEGKGQWYHDALALVTCKKSIKYIQDSNFTTKHPQQT
jgi:hypothetical protein